MKLITKLEDREQKQRLDTLIEAVTQSLDNEDLLKERIAELEFAWEDKDFIQLNELGDGKQFSRSFLRKINYWARLYWLKNPLIKRAVNTQTQYVFGQGINIQADDETINEVLQAFLDNSKNRIELTDHQSRMVKETELQINANLFFVFFVNQFTGTVSIRTIPADEIEDIICDPEDNKTPLYYKRVYYQKEYNLFGRDIENKQKTVFYPDFRSTDYKGPVRLSGVEQEAFVYHIAVNKLSDMKFGVSEVYAAIDWSKAYKEFLEDWATIAKALSRFAWRVKSKGGKRGLQNVKDKLKTSLGSGSATENNPPPAAGSMLLEPEDKSMEPIRTAGVVMKAEDGNKIINMVSAGTGIFYHYLTGDPSTGNLATAKSMERPMEIMFRDRQQLWVSIFTEIINFVIKQSIKAPKGKLTSMAIIELDDYGEEQVKWSEGIDTNIHISFPDILQKDIDSLVKAIVSVATLDGKKLAGTLDMETVTRMLLEVLGEENIDEIIEKMPEMPPEQPTEGQNMVVEAIKKLKEVISKHNGQEV